MDRLEEIERQIKRAENASGYAEANALLANTKYLFSRLKAAEAVVEAARFYVAASLERTELDDAIEAYDELKS